MATVNKSYESKMRAIVVSEDGASVSASIEWLETGAKTPAALRTGLRLAGGKVFANNVEVGAVPPELASAATTIAARTRELVEGLVAAGKIKP